MKILIVHNAYPDYGGEDTVVANEIAMLEKHGCVVVPWIVPTEEGGILNLIRCGLSAVWNPFAARKLHTLLKRERPDIVHCHNTFPLLSPSIFAACHDAGIPVVQTIHNYRHICPAGGFFRNGGICEECIGKTFPLPVLKHGCYRGSRVASAVPAMTAYVQRIRHTFERDVDALIALNVFEKDKLIAGGIPADRIVIKPNFCLEPDREEERPPAGDEPFTVCFAGRFSEDKGIPVLLTAWQRFVDSLPAGNQPPARLLIAGCGELEADVSAASSQHASINYLGSLSHRKAVEMIRQSDVLVCPSLWYEGMPMTLLEAFSVGTAVLASRIGGLPEMVEEGKNGFLFQPGNAQELEVHLQRLYTSPELRRDMGQCARKIYLDRYSEPVNFPLLENIYRETIQRFQSSR